MTTQQEANEMDALQTWLQHHNMKITQDAIDIALMEYIEHIEKKNAKLVEALAALDAVKEPEPVGWQPIEIAPKDYTKEILAMTDAGQMVVFFADGYWREKANWLGLKHAPNPLDATTSPTKRGDAMNIFEAIKNGWRPVPFVGWVSVNKIWSDGNQLIAKDLEEVQDFEDSKWSDMR